MDDGSKTKNSYVLNTQNFSKEDQMLLIDSLKQYNLHSSLHKDKTFFKLYISAYKKNDFTLLIKPFILSCFFYKLHEIKD